MRKPRPTKLERGILMQCNSSNSTQAFGSGDTFDGNAVGSRAKWGLVFVRAFENVVNSGGNRFREGGFDVRGMKLLLFEVGGPLRVSCDERARGSNQIGDHQCVLLSQDD